MPSTEKKSRLRRFFVTMLVSLVAIVLLAHILLNNAAFQRKTLRFIGSILAVDINATNLKFNALTGHFSGEAVAIILKQSNSVLSLKNVALAVNPLKLPFRKLDLINLTADQVSFNIPTFPERSDAAKRPPQAIVELYSRVSVRRADINDITLQVGTDQTLKLGKLKMTSRPSLTLIGNTVNLALTGLTIKSPKLDVFLDSLSLNGALELKMDKMQEKIAVETESLLKTNGLLVGFNKKPTPWNTAAPWDESLRVLLMDRYAGTIPENRTFAFIEKMDLPLGVKESRLFVSRGDIRGFQGHVSLDLSWTRDNGAFSLDLTTPRPLSMALLPLGKAQARTLYRTLAADVKLKGILTDQNLGSLAGSLMLQAEGNTLNETASPLEIRSPLRFDDGDFFLNDIKVSLMDGNLTGKATINVPGKKISSRLKGNNLDVNTVFHFFSKIDFPGKLDADGSIEGDLLNPTFQIGLTSPETGYESLTLGSFNGELTIRDRNLTLKGNSNLDGGTGRVELFIRDVFTPITQTMDLQATFSGLPLTRVLRSQTISGKGQASINLKRLDHKMSGDGQVAFSEVLWGKIPIREIKAKMLFGEKNLDIVNVAFTFPNAPGVTVPKGLKFKFRDTGYDFEGNILPTVSVKGSNDYSNREVIRFSLDASKTNLDFLIPAIAIPTLHLEAQGKLNGELKYKTPFLSHIKGSFSHFMWEGDEGRVARLTSSTSIDMEGGKVIFHNAPLQFGTGKLVLNGPLGLTEDSQLAIKGMIDLEALPGLVPWLTNGEGLVKADLVYKGKPKEPLFAGNVIFEGAWFQLSGVGREFSDIFGKLAIEGKKYTFTNFRAVIEDGTALVNGSFELDLPNITSADLHLEGKDIPLISEDVWQALGDMDVRLKGAGAGLTLSGNIWITEGIYYKDYNLSQFILKPVGVLKVLTPSPFMQALSRLNLDLNVQSTGDFEIKNNLADLAMKGAVRVRGNLDNPNLDGTIDVSEGEIHAFGIDFENATGFITFGRQRGALVSEPMVDFTASHLIQEYEIKARIKGYASNLGMTLESTPPLNNNDVISLIAYGQTPEQLSGNRRDLFSTQAVASQVVGLLQRPLSKATKLDIVKLESVYNAVEPTASRLSIGKRLSERLSVAFTTDLALDEAQKGFTLEYQILDNLLLKGMKDTGSKYRFDLTWRFETYIP